MFADFIRQLRIEKRLLLSDFCRKAEVDPRYWSQVELGKEIPPQQQDALARIAVVLGIEGTAQFEQLKELSKSAVVKCQSEAEFAQSLPLFCRTIRNDKPTKEELFRVASLLRRASS